MSDAPALSLIVIRVSDIERSAAFYSALGFTFKREQHGSGPSHYSAWVGDILFELYPASEQFPATTLRMGFVVSSIDSVLEVWRQYDCEILSEPKDSLWGLRAVVADPDGHRIELTQRNNNKYGNDKGGS